MSVAGGESEARPGPARRAFARIGRPFAGIAGEALSLAGTFRHTSVLIVRGPIRWRQVLVQAHEIGNGSLAFITATLGFLGMISVFQVGLQIQQILPDYSMVGPAFIQITIRETGPTIAALMVATRVGSGIAAEIGSMRVTEQIDALRMSNADPIAYLVVPRTIACTAMVFVLTVYGSVVATFAGMVMADSAFGVNYRTFLSLRLVGVDDVLTGVAKAVCYGYAIPIIAGHAGLGTTGGSEGVGWATTRSVVNTSFAVVVLDFVISGIGYLVAA